MRFESVTAYAFGPLRDEKLELAPGMNVVYGPNEAGKSSWHAALYAGLCGMRRSRGRAARDDAFFAELHRPWDNNTLWDVGVIITLDDGRRVELRHDLAGRVNSSARDVDIAGRNYSNEIMEGGAPNGARWLGLNRRSFIMTACIRQADILGLRNAPSDLQDELQRAADTGDRDGTAAEALVRLRDFHASSVGSTRAPTKPLRVTERQVWTAEQRMKQAQDEHEEYLSRWKKVDELDQQARNQEQRLAAARAARATAAASEAAERLQRAWELTVRLPHGRPRFPSEDAQLVQRVASALTAWESRPAAHEPTGPTMAELEQDLARVEAQLGRVAVSTAHEPQITGRGPFAMLVRTIRWFLAFLLRLFGSRPPSPSSAPEQVLEERRALILQRIAARADVERQWKENAQRVRDATDAVQKAATAIGLTASCPDAAAASLVEWQDRHNERLTEIDNQMKDWEELRQILGEGALDDLAGKVEHLRTEARRLSAKISIGDMAKPDIPPSDTELTHAEREASEARTSFHRAQSQLEVFALELTDVAEVEETLEAEKAEYDRVRSLGRTLDLTISFLEQAEYRVHRTIAPVLANTVRDWLPRVTSGRYTDCRIDPEKLAVEVATADRHWRRAEILSHGTAEQVYLLLRLALARHLTSQGCPLILDDAVTASDSQRKHNLLDTLLAISDSTQVILFTHEDDVCTWARGRLMGKFHKLTELVGPAR